MSVSIPAGHKLVATDFDDYEALSARMGVSLRRVAAQTLNDVSDTTVSWDTEDEDTHNLWTSGTTVTIPTGGSGLWAITFGFDSAANSTARSLLWIEPSAGQWTGSKLRNSFGSGEDICTITGVIPLSAGNTFTCVISIDMAAPSTMTATLSAYRVGL